MSRASSAKESVYFSLGSNIEAEKHLRLAIRELHRRYGELRLSPVYRNKAVGFDGDDFLNMVVGIDAEGDIETMLGEIEVIHGLAGRRRGKSRFSSRPLDIDILLYGQRVSKAPPVTLPRPDVLRYPFVLKPLSDVAPEGVHPETGRSFAEHWQAMKQGGHTLHRLDIEFQ